MSHAPVNDVGSLAVVAITLLLLFYSGMLFEPAVVRRQLEPAGLRDLSRLAAANYVLVPLATLGIIWWFEFSPILNLVLMTMAMLPCAALVPPLVSLVGEAPQRSLFAFFALSVLNIAATPILVALLAIPWVSGDSLSPNGGAVMAVIKYVIAVFTPMGLGVAFRIGAPRHCATWQPRLRKALPLLMALVAVLFVYSYREQLRALGWRDLEALVLFEAACIAIGWGLSIGAPQQRVATILICALRNTAMGLAFALVVYPHTAAPTYMLVFVSLSFLGAVVGVRLHGATARPA